MELPVAEFDRNEAAERVWETFPDSTVPEEDDDVSFDVESFDAAEADAQPASSADGSFDEALAPASTSGGGTRQSSPLMMQTAADLAGEKRVERPTVSPEVFHQGMAVLHPEYGPGKIIALSGAGLRRVATVAFAANGQKKFILAQSPLRPIRRP
jgi:DNA helicase-2/ATP-dependent DNA helicase PcrA